MHAQRQGTVCTLNLFQLFNQSPSSKYPPHLPLARPNSLSKRTVTKTRTDGHTSPLQVIMHLLIRLERFENLFTEEWLLSYSHHWFIVFLGVLLTCYSLLEPTLVQNNLCTHSLCLFSHRCWVKKWNRDSRVYQSTIIYPEYYESIAHVIISDAHIHREVDRYCAHSQYGEQKIKILSCGVMPMFAGPLIEVPPPLHNPRAHFDSINLGPGLKNGDLSFPTHSAPGDIY